MNILLAVDNSPHSQVAVDVVMSCVWPEKTTFKVICAVERRQPIFAVMERKEADAFLNKALEAAQGFTKEIVDQLCESFPNCTAVNEAKFGDSKEIILDQSHWADLIVVGAHGRHGVPRFFLGSVSQTVLLYGECSTLVARYQQSRAGTAKFDDNILVAVDNTDDSRKAFDWILNHPWSDDARFTLLFVIQSAESLSNPSIETANAAAPQASLQDLKNAGNELLENYANDLEEKVGIGKVNIELRIGDPVDEILKFANSIPAGLIVMGARTRGRMLRFFMGSVAQEVVLKAPCPVEIVKQKC